MTDSKGTALNRRTPKLLFFAWKQDLFRLKSRLWEVMDATC